MHKLFIIFLLFFVHLMSFANSLTDEYVTIVNEERLKNIKSNKRSFCMDEIYLKYLLHPNPPEGYHPAI